MVSQERNKVGVTSKINTAAPLVSWEKAEPSANC